MLSKPTLNKSLPYLLNILMPGLGHLLVREIAFGIFVFLVTVLAIMLFFVSFLVPMPVLALWVLLGLPVIFYLFTFLDLARSIRKRSISPTLNRTAWVFLVVGIVYQAFAPTGAVNFVARNHPTLFVMGDTRFAPTFNEGQLIIANPLAYKVRLAFVDHPFIVDLPRRFDLVRATDAHGRSQSGLVIGLPNEYVEVIDGSVIVNGELVPMPAQIFGDRLRGDCPLTIVDESSILLANVRLGTLVNVAMVPLVNLDGKLSALF